MLEILTLASSANYIGSDIEYSSIIVVRVGTDKMIPRYAYHKSFKIQLLDKSE